MPTIFVRLLDEGTEVWRPVHAEEVGPLTFHFDDQVPSEELWEFPAGSIVRCENRVLSSSGPARVLVAVEIVTGR
jgi:hypothetical protein